MRCCLYTCLFLLTASSLFSQSIDEKNFTFYGYKQGLSGNYITGILQDSSGYIWISTRRGLNRFDGKIFKHFLHNDKYNSIPDNSIYSMRLIDKETLAIATEDGAQVISTSTLKQVNFSIDDDRELRYWSNACRSLMVDAAGNFGVSTKTGFYIFSSSGKLNKRFDFYNRADIGNKWMLFGHNTHALPNGNIMQVNDEGLLMFDRQKGQFTDATLKYPLLKLVADRGNNLFSKISTTEFLHLNVVTNTIDLIDVQKGQKTSFASCMDLREHLGWWSTITKISDSAWAINCQTKGFFIVKLDPVTKTYSCSPTKYFPDKICTYFFADRQNNLWIGTSEGLYKQNARPKIIETFSINKTILDGTVISALYISADKIFAGTDQNKVLVLDKTSKKLLGSIQLGKSATLSNYVRSFLGYHKDTLWAGTSSGLSWINMQNLSFGKIDFYKNAESPSIYLLYKDSRKDIWMSTFTGNAVYHRDSQSDSFTLIDEWKQPLLKTGVRSFAEDKYGNVWMSGDAIVRWNIKKQQVDTLIMRLLTQQNFKRGYCVMADSKGDIWTTAPEDGIASLTGNTLHLRPGNLTQEKTTFMSPVLLNDKIFVYTNNGVGYFDITRLTSILFNELDGLPGETASTYLFVNDSTDGSVWFACKNTICRIPPNPSTNYLKAPAIGITALSILNDTIFNYPGAKISLNNKQGDINIFYSAINYTDPENMRFSYRIVNKKDSSWIEAGDQQNILLTNIAPGNYKLQLRVSAFDNKWVAQSTELEINIKPPFWRTWSFIIPAALIIAALGYFLYRYRIRQIKQKANIDKQLAQAEMKALHAQMNPHFIFNCLNSIREMILDNENKQASLYLSKFARLIRITLNHSAKQFVSLADTIDYLERYIEMEKIRSSHFSYTMEVAPDLNPDDILVPPMLIQPFIENAIWHGSSPKKNMDIHISFKKKGNELICIVDDNGIGIEESLKKKESINNEPSVGISNIRQRIGLLNEKYNLQSTVKVEDKAEKTGGKVTGTIVTLHLLIKTNDSI